MERTEKSKRKVYYRRWLFLMLAFSLIFSVYYLNQNPPQVFLQENIIDKEQQVRGVVAAGTENNMKVYPCGFQVGIYLETSGVMVIGTDEVKGMDGINYSPALNKVKAGDYITKMNDIDVSSKNQLMFLINKYGAEDVILTVRRNEKLIEVKVSPVKTGDEEYKMGIWIRDDTQGIGTMTYLTDSGEYGALGHGISDIDTGELLDSEGGLLYCANVWGIKKGENGSPGALYGMITYENQNRLGSIEKNTSKGIYGNLMTTEIINHLVSQYQLNPVELGSKTDIKKGKAYLRSNVSGSICDYEIEIEKINLNNNKNRGIVLKVTDERLLNLTNGIVQGMSGTPIIQDGKLIGAVTHVFVNDSTKGYGIFIENMMEH